MPPQKLPAPCTLASGLTEGLRSSSVLPHSQQELDTDVQFRDNRARTARWTICVPPQRTYTKQREVLSSGDQPR